MARIWLAIRVAAWICTLPLRWDRGDLPTILRRIGAAPRSSKIRAVTPDSIRVVRRVCSVSLFRLPIFPRPCLREALALFHVLGRAGQPVRFFVGVRKHGDALLAHSWVSCPGYAGVLPDRDHGFLTVFSY